jgi:aldehyde:ferredoxin oxidoreductase
MDATPGRHTQMSAWTVEANFCPPGLVTEPFDKYTYSGKAHAHRLISNSFHVANAAGQCMFSWIALEPDVMVKSLTYTTGHEYTLAELDQMGARMAALRIAFNLREGIRNIDFAIPGRLIGSPPLEAGPLAGVTVDIDTQVREYLEEMGWDPVTGVPEKETLEELGLDNVAVALHG